MFGDDCNCLDFFLSFKKFRKTAKSTHPRLFLTDWSYENSQENKNSLAHLLLFTSSCFIGPCRFDQIRPPTGRRPLIAPLLPPSDRRKSKLHLPWLLFARLRLLFFLYNRHLTPENSISPTNLPCSSLPLCSSAGGVSLSTKDSRQNATTPSEGRSKARNSNERRNFLFLDRQRTYLGLRKSRRCTVAPLSSTPWSLDTAKTRNL